MEKQRFELVIVESPFSAKLADGSLDAHMQTRHIEYARKCMFDCLQRGEAPFASHLLYTQEGVLDDTVPEERIRGIDAGFAWHSKADRMVVYIDFGISTGMEAGIANATKLGLPIEKRTLPKASLP